MDLINHDSPRALYYLAEAKRIFDCKSLTKIDTLISNLLKDNKSLTDLNDLYYANLINQKAKSYKIESPKGFNTLLKEKALDDLVKNFKDKDFIYEKGDIKYSGITSENL